MSTEGEKLNELIQAIRELTEKGKANIIVQRALLSELFKTFKEFHELRKKPLRIHLALKPGNHSKR